MADDGKQARFITIRVEGREQPVCDISDFTVYEAYAVVDKCLQLLMDLVDDAAPIVMADGETLEVTVPEDVE
jgi:hypothetical protein